MAKNWNTDNNTIDNNKKMNFISFPFQVHFLNLNAMNFISETSSNEKTIVTTDRNVTFCKIDKNLPSLINSGIDVKNMAFVGVLSP